MEIVIPKSLWPRQFGDWTSAWDAVAESEALRVVLPAGAFVAPCIVAPLAAVIASRASRSLTTSFRIEDATSDAFRYLQRSDFFRALDVAVDEPFERHEAPSLVALRRILDTRVARELATDLGDFLEGQLGEKSTSVLRFARFVFEELGANIVQHSRATATGFGLAQAYPTRSRFQFAFADAGVGFLASLQENPELGGRLHEDGEALQIALEPRVSKQGPGNIGSGLSLLRDFTDRLEGDLLIASGEALLHRRTIGSGARANSVSRIAPWKGAWLCVDAPLPDA